MPEVPPISHEDHHGALVRRFTTELKPTRSPWPAGVRLGLWMGLEVAVLTIAVMHASNHFMLKLKQPIYAMEVLFFAAAAVICASQALRSAIPGQRLRRRDSVLAVVLVVLGTVLVAGAVPLNLAYPLGEFVRVGMPCAFSTLALAAMPLVALWWLVKRAAPLRGGLSGTLVGGGGFLFSFAILRLVCPIDEPLHLLTWHLLPVLGAITLAALAGRARLRLRLPAQPRQPLANWRL